MKQNTTPGNERHFKTMSDNTKRLLHLIDQLTTFRKIEQGHLDLKLTRTKIGEFIYSTTEAFEEFALHKGINFFYKINNPDEEIVVDIEKIERILFNLLSNAFRHTPESGDISINTEVINIKGEKMVQFDIIDTGKGIPQKQQEKIFERFYQVNNKKDNTGSTGIGLAYCKSLVEMMKGRLSVESQPGVRTCFSVIIPATVDIDADMINEKHEEESFIKEMITLKTDNTDNKIIEHLPNRKKTATVMVIDDEAEIREFLRNELHEKYTIVSAENGREGLEKLKSIKPDLIICDVLMPEMNGFELCETVKSNSTTCHIPFILLTALDDQDNQIKGLEFGADDYISKPFSPKHISIRVEKLIENRRKIKEYFTKNSDVTDETIEMSSRDKKFLEDLNNIINKNMSDSNFGIEELSKTIGISTSHLYRKLKQLTGHVPNAYLRNYRLHKAAEIMRSNQGLTGLEVMYQIGIESNSYFSNVFNKLYGVRPSVYIKNHSSQGDNSTEKTQ